QASVGNQIQMIPVDDVLFFVSDEKYTRVQTAQQEALIRKPIKELLAELDPAQFWQIHRSTLINARAIAGIVRDDRGRQLVAVKGRAGEPGVNRSHRPPFQGIVTALYLHSLAARGAAQQSVLRIGAEEQA